MRSSTARTHHGPSAAAIFAALGDPYRLSIVERLCEEGPLPTIKLNGGEGDVSRQGLTKHLRVLETAGLVDSVRIGRHRLWKMRTEPLTAVRAYLDQVSQEWDSRLQRLQSLLVDSDENPTASK